MARNGHSGHPLKWFKDQNAARHAYECAICLEVLEDPVQVRDCGHQFCALCIDDILKTDPRCPSCRIEISKSMVFEDHAARRLINQLEVNCCNEGCSWQGCLSSLLQDHQNSCNFLIRSGENVRHLDVGKLEQQLVSTLEKLEQDVKVLKELKVKLEEDIKELKLKHEEDIKELKLKHEQDVNKLELKHENELKAVKAKYQSDLKQVQAVQESKLEQFKTKDPVIERHLEVSLDEIATGTTRKLKLKRKIYNERGGYTQEEKFLEITIKPGWKAGTKLTYPNLGDQNPGREPADITFILKDKPHALFSRDSDNNLLHTANVTLQKALLGVSYCIQGLNGQRHDVNVNDIVYPGFVKRYPGEGLPLPMMPSKRGDLVVTFNIEFPTFLSWVQRRVLSDCLPN